MNYIRSNSKEGGWLCRCGQVFRTRRALQEHRKICKCSEVKNRPSGFQERSEVECPFCNKKWITTKSGFLVHKKYCKDNPNREICKGHPLSEETRKHLSEVRLKNIREGKISPHFPSRKGCKPSYPEQWFMDELKRNYNLIEGKDYVRELSFYKFFLDFAWPEKKFCVEIDGEQHHQFQDRIESDIKKDDLLKRDGWTEIRVDWSYICNNKKKFMDDFFQILNSLNTIEEANQKYSFLGQRALDNYYEKRAALIAEGRVGPSGMVSKRIASDKDWLERKEKILASNVDLMKFGYVEKVSNITGLSRKLVRQTILKFNIPHWSKKTN